MGCREGPDGKSGNFDPSCLAAQRLRSRFPHLGGLLCPTPEVALRRCVMWRGKPIPSEVQGRRD